MSAKKLKTPRKFKNQKSLFKWQKQNIKHIKRIDNNGHISDLVQVFLHSEHGELNQVLKQAKTSNCK